MFLTNAAGMTDMTGVTSGDKCDKLTFKNATTAYCKETVNISDEMAEAIVRHYLSQPGGATTTNFVLCFETLIIIGWTIWF